MREAPSRVLMEALWDAGAKVRAFDPVAMPECTRIYGQRADLALCKNSPEALRGCRCAGHRDRMAGISQPGLRLHQGDPRAPVIFDGRNLYDPAHMARAGFSYYAIGRA